MTLTRIKEREHQFAVIGAAILRPETCGALTALLPPEAFAEGPLRRVFGAIRQLVREGKAVDELTVKNLVDTDCRDMIVEACETVPTLQMSNVKAYAALVLEDYCFRTLQEKGTRILAQKDDADTTAQELQALLDEYAQLWQRMRNDTASSGAEAAQAAVKALHSKDPTFRLRCPALDEHLLYGPGLVSVIAGRPGDGKTDLALTVAIRLAVKHRVYYFAMEESRVALANRLLSKATHIEAKRLAQRDLSEAEKLSLEHCARMIDDHMTIDEDTELTLELLKAKLKTGSYEVAVIDHLGLIEGDPHKTEYENLKKLTRALKKLAKQRNICIIEVVQLNRLVDKNGGPRQAELADLRGSGSIEQDADSVLILETRTPRLAGPAYPEDIQPFTIHIAKNRSGSRCRVEAQWQPQYHNIIWGGAGAGEDSDGGERFEEYEGPTPFDEAG